MRSRKKKKGSSLTALLIGLGLPALALFAVFSLIPYERMTGDWPIGIGQEEVYAYQEWFDQRPDTMPDAVVEELRIEVPGGCEEDGERAGTFGTSDRMADAAIERDGRVWYVHTGGNGPDRLTYRMEPARMAYSALIYAAELLEGSGLLSAGSRLVRLTACGTDRGTCLMEEVIDDLWARRHGPLGARPLGEVSSVRDSLFKREAERAVKAFMDAPDSARIDASAAATWGVLQTATTGTAPGPVRLLFDPVNARFIPAWGGIGQDTMGSGIGMEILVRYLRTTDGQRRMRAVVQAMRKDSARLAERLATLDARNAAYFTGETRVGYVRAQLAKEREGFLRRLFTTDPQAVFGPVEDAGPSRSLPKAELDPWLRRYLQGDTIRIPRAKHPIDRVITVPAGYGLVLEKGARLNMAPGSGIIVHGALHMRGTVLNPVFIRPMEEGVPWAGIHVLGEGRTRCTVTGLKMSGGGAALPGSDLPPAMLAFAGCDVSISGSAVGEAASGTVLAVYRGGILLKETLIGPAPRALLDITFARAELTGCALSGGTATIGVRAIGSELEMSGGSVTRCGGAGALLSEHGRTTLRRVTFSANGTAVQVLDGTEAVAEGCSFLQNTVGVEVGRSRADAPGGAMVSRQNTFSGNGTDRKLAEAQAWKEETGPPAAAAPSAGRRR